jgi:hypothetical protein
MGTVVRAAAKFPLYAIRTHESIDEEDGFIIIKSYKGRWVLDLVEKEGDYLSRRLKILGMEDIRPYPIYPLYNRVDSYKQLIESNYKLFIDQAGQIFKFNKTRRYPLKNERIVRFKELSATVALIWLKESGGPFKVKNWYNQLFARVLHVGMLREVWEIRNEPYTDTWRKI